MSTKAYISAISTYLPEKILTNEELVKDFPEWSVEKVAKKIGINSRHIAGENETSADLAEKAAKNLFKEWDIDSQNIDFVLLCTQSPDYFLPTTACILQDKLNIPTSAGALDINLGCSGYIYGLALAKGLIAGNMAKNILLITAETYNKYIHKEDKGNRSIFGDAAAATLVSTSGFAAIENFDFGTDGSGAKNLIVKNGGMRNPKSGKDFVLDDSGAILSDDHLYMNGGEIFSFSQKNVPIVVENVLNINHLEKDDIDLFVFHQANKYMLNFLRKKIKIPKEKFHIHMESTGNTVSSSIPLALKNAVDEDESMLSGKKLMLVGFGVGYSWGGVVLIF